VYKTLYGPLYPYTKIIKSEEGDLGHHTKYGIKKQVIWETDSYGFRRRNTQDKDIKIVIIGDSNIYGASLTQDDILSNVLERKLGVGVYPLAPGTINTYIRDKRFAEHPPKVVILCRMERNILDLPDIDINSGYFNLPIHSSLLNNIEITSNRIIKCNMLNYIRAVVNGRGKNYAYEKNGILFYAGDKANSEVSKKNIDNTIGRINKYNDYFASRNIKFIFLPIPNKENTLHYMLPSQQKPVFLKNLISGLRNNNVTIIDTDNEFYKKQMNGTVIFNSDDSHWNRTGVEIAADLVYRSLE
jgi:hypothetical protein